MSNRNEQRTPDELRDIDAARDVPSFQRALSHERAYQDRKWGDPPLHQHTPSEWALVLTKEFGEAIAELFRLTFTPTVSQEEIVNLRRELVQVAAICQAIAQELPVDSAK